MYLKSILIVLLFPLCLFGQTFTPTTGEHAITIAGHSCRYFLPAGYDTVHVSRLRLILAFSPLDAGTKMDTTQLTKFFISGAWSGKVAMNNGDTMRNIYFVIPAMGFTMADYDTCINAALLSFSRIDTSLHETFGLTAYFDAVGLAYLWKNNGRAALTSLFQKGVFVQSALTFQSVAWSNTGKWKLYYATNDPHADYAPSITRNKYALFSGGKSIDSCTLPIATHNNSIADSAMHVNGLGTATGGTAANSRIRWLNNPDDGIVYRNKIAVDSLDVIDLVGGSGDARTYFDKQSADPERSINTPCPDAHCPRPDARYYPSKFPGSYGKREWRIGVNLRGEHVVKGIAYYVGNNSYYGDSLIIYGSDNCLDYKRIGIVNIPIGIPEGWYMMNIYDTCRYIFAGLRFAHPLSYGVPNLAQIICYGELLGSREPLPTFKGYPRPLPTIDQCLGINTIGGVEEEKFMKVFKNHRIMQEATWMMDTAYESSGRKNFNWDHWQENGWGYHRTQKGMIDTNSKYNRYTTLLLNSGAGRLADSGYTGMRINNTKADWYNPASYTEGARLFYTVAQAYGSRVWPTGPMNQTRVTKFSGYNMNGMITSSNSTKPTKMNISNGNEQNGFWKADDTSHALMFQGNLSYVIQSQVEVDGYEKRFGDTLGIWNGDSTACLSGASLYEIDDMVVQSRYLLSKAMRNDKKHIFGRVQLNKYWHTETAPQVGTHPVEDSACYKLRKFSKHVYTLDTSVELEYTEFGYDANTGSVQSVPRTGSAWTDREWQAIMLNYALFELSGSYVDRSYTYVAVTNNVESANGRFATSGLWATYFSGPVDIRYAAWYQFAGIQRLMTGYREESVISYGAGGKYLKKYRSIFHPDSVAYVIGKISRDGSTLSNVTIPVGNLIGSAVVHDISFVAETSSVQNISPVSGMLTISTVSEKPLIVLAKEASAMPPTFYKTVPRRKIYTWKIQP